MIIQLETNESGEIEINKEMVRLFCHDDFGIQMYQNIKNSFYKTNQGAYLGLHIVTDLSAIAIVYQRQPFKVSNYIQYILSNSFQFTNIYAKKTTNFIAQILTERIKNKSSNMKLIISELSHIDYEKPDKKSLQELYDKKLTHSFDDMVTYFGKRYEKAIYFRALFNTTGASSTKQKESITNQRKILNNDLYQHINWYNKDSLRPFIQALKENKLIKTRETDLIIRDHFEPHREQNSKPEPIQWLNDNRYVAYLFHRLIEENYITVQGSKQKQLASHFISQYGKPLKPSSLSSQLSMLLKNQPVKNHKTVQLIEKIIRELPDSNY